MGIVKPPMEYLQKYLDQGPHDGGHWFWKDRRKNHGFNTRGQAIVKWKVKPCAESKWKIYGQFTVVRLLLEYGNPLPKGVRIPNVCGLSQCVNPSHWRIDAPLVPWRLVSLPADQWELVHNKTGRPADRQVAVFVVDAGVVHVVNVIPRARRGLGPPIAVCGAALSLLFASVTGNAATCEGCRG
jgi:hypothetical protein